MKNIDLKKILKSYIFAFFVFFFLLFLILFILAFKKPSSVGGDIKWSVSFSHTFASSLGLEWRGLYLKLLDDLNPATMRIPVYWSEIEKKNGVFNFDDYDFMMDEAEKRNVPVVLVVGERVPRWPECHIPNWAKKIERYELENELLDAIKSTVERYKNRTNLSMWQVENEPFLMFFGECPFPNFSALDSKIELVRLLDPSRKIMITDSGELSIWLPAAKRADVFGTTMYRIVWSDFFSRFFGYIEYPLPPRFFWIKANLVHLFYGSDKSIIVSELQAEPWTSEYPLDELPLEEQVKSMDMKKFKDNIQYAKDVGFPEVYLWGVEWWYWQKEKNNNSEYWDYAKKLFWE